MEGITIGRKYRVFQKIGSGSFGELYEGLNKDTGKRVAIKFESIHSNTEQLFKEYKLYKSMEGIDGIPQVYFFEVVPNSCNVLVMELLSSDIGQVFEGNRNGFKLDTIAYIGYHSLVRLERIHECGIIHRDVKPENFMFGTDSKSDVIYAIDFGLAKRYRDPNSNQHIPERTGKSLTGTARYASIRSHLGFEQSRRDDLESLAYMLIFFLRGCLPWQGLPADTKNEKYMKILEKKQTTSTELLCRGYPEEVRIFLDRVRSLPFTADPSYQFYRSLFFDIWKKNYPGRNEKHINMQTDLIRNLPLQFTYEVDDKSHPIYNPNEFLDDWYGTNATEDFELYNQPYAPNYCPHRNSVLKLLIQIRKTTDSLRLSYLANWDRHEILHNCAYNVLANFTESMQFIVLTFLRFFRKDFYKHNLSENSNVHDHAVVLFDKCTHANRGRLAVLTMICARSDRLDVSTWAKKSLDQILDFTKECRNNYILHFLSRRMNVALGGPSSSSSSTSSSSASFMALNNKLKDQRPIKSSNALSSSNRLVQAVQTPSSQKPAKQIINLLGEDDEVIQDNPLAGTIGMRAQIGDNNNSSNNNNNKNHSNNPNTPALNNASTAMNTPFEATTPMSPSTATMATHLLGRRMQCYTNDNKKNVRGGAVLSMHDRARSFEELATDNLLNMSELVEPSPVQQRSLSNLKSDGSPRAEYFISSTLKSALLRNGIHFDDLNTLPIGSQSGNIPGSSSSSRILRRLPLDSPFLGDNPDVTSSSCIINSIIAKDIRNNKLDFGFTESSKPSGGDLDNPTILEVLKKRKRSLNDTNATSKEDIVNGASNNNDSSIIKSNDGAHKSSNRILIDLTGPDEIDTSLASGRPSKVHASSRSVTEGAWRSALIAASRRKGNK